MALHAREPLLYLRVLTAVASLTEPVRARAGVERTAASVLAVSAEDGVAETPQLRHIATPPTPTVKMPEL